MEGNLGFGEVWGRKFCEKKAVQSSLKKRQKREVYFAKVEALRDFNWTLITDNTCHKQRGLWSTLVRAHRLFPANFAFRCFANLIQFQRREAISAL